MARDYSVGAVVRLTGLSEHTLRAWERRHRAVVPRRSAGGTRRYSERDVTRLRLLAAAVAAGQPIRELAGLTDEELSARAARAPAPPHPRLAELFAALERLDLAGLERQLGMHLSALGPLAFIESVAVPFLCQVGERWQNGSLRIADEHAASAALRATLLSGLRSAPGGGRPLVLATPAGESHELGILMAALAAQEHGARVLYLGADLPAAEIAQAALRARAAAVGLGIVCLPSGAAAREVRALRAALPDEIELWLGGAAALRLRALPAGVRVVRELGEIAARLGLLAEHRA